MGEIAKAIGTLQKMIKFEKGKFLFARPSLYLSKRKKHYTYLMPFVMVIHTEHKVHTAILLPFSQTDTL